MSVAKFSCKKIHAEILSEAKVLGLHPGTAEMIADRVDVKLSGWVKKRSMVTSEDLNEKVASEIKKYNKDLAYLFRNREKVI